MQSIKSNKKVQDTKSTVHGSSMRIDDNIYDKMEENNSILETDLNTNSNYENK